MPNKKINKPVALIILDGWGYREEIENNAVAAANTPFFDGLWKKYPHSLLEASGLAVGLPEGQMGNSEVGHTTIGAGTIIYTDLVRIGLAIKNGKFDKNDTLQKIFNHTKKNDSTLHLLGLVGNGGVHAHGDHLIALLKSAKLAGVKRVAIHAFTDGRDTSPQSAEEFISELEKFIDQNKFGFIASLAGRYYAMDRDKNWDRLKKVEEALFSGKGQNAGGQKASAVIKTFYKKGIFDEHFEPVVFLDSRGQTETIKENDAVFFFNFRADRARMLSQKIIDFSQHKNILFGTMTEYDKNFSVPVAFPANKIETTLANEIAEAGLTQAHIAETEKFAHATYFLNGGKEEPHKNEAHILVPSRKDVATHDLAPEMRAEEIANKAIEEINKGTDFIFINFANPDMVGHTANKEAIIQALEKVDKELKRVVEAIIDKGGVTLVTADHGNAEVNIDPVTGEKHTAHTTNPVPFIFIGEAKRVRNGTLADLTPTILKIFDLAKPQTMLGQSLLD